MNLPDLSDHETILSFANDSLHWPVGPWDAPRRIEGYYRSLCRELCSRHDVQERSEYDNYGSGYASYVDVWFYKNQSDFKSGVGFKGLWILFHRKTPFYAMGQGEKSWSHDRGASYLPTWEDVDEFASSAVQDLSSAFESDLEGRGLIRLRKEQLQAKLPHPLQIETILNDQGNFRLFDALFHWID